MSAPDTPPPAPSNPSNPAHPAGQPAAPGATPAGDRANDDLRARLRDAALGELDPAESARLAADLAGHPAAAAWQAERARLAALIAAAESHPALATFQPREAWRTQTLHKAKVEAARLRRQREAQNLPVARPPMTHRQLAGITPQSITVGEDDGNDFPRPLLGWPPGFTPGPATPVTPNRPVRAGATGVRRLFLAVAIVAAAGVLALALLAAQLLHHWQVDRSAPAPAATPGPAALPADPAAQALSPRELLLLKRDYPDMGQVLNATADSVLFELGGPVPGKGWLDVSEPAAAPAAAPRLYKCLAPSRWDRIDLEGDLHEVTLHFIADAPQGLSLQISPRPPDGTPPTPPAPNPTATPRPPADGWQLTLLKNGQAVQTFDIPGPVGGTPYALAIERVTLNTGEEQLRFQAVPNVVTAPFGPASALGREWQVLSERLLPVPCAPGHWVIELPARLPPPPTPAPPAPPVNLDGSLQYLLQARLPRATLAPRSAE